MTRTVWVVIVFLILVIGIPAALMSQPSGSKPGQEISRAVIVPTTQERRVIVPPCGTGAPVSSESPAALAKTPGTVVLLLKKNRGDRILVIPRCRASQGAQPSEGANLPAAAFILPIGANVDAGRAGSIAAGTELVQEQLQIPANQPIRDVVVAGCIESKQQAKETATGRTLILKAVPGRPSEALAPPC